MRSKLTHGMCAINTGTDVLEGNKEVLWGNRVKGIKDRETDTVRDGKQPF